MPKPRVPRPTAKRLSLYLRELEAQQDRGQPTSSSKQLGTALGLTDAQVRKDLAIFGQFGHPGIGYKIPELIAQLRKILGTDRSWNAAIVGAGNIGRALMPYARFRRKGFEIVAVFDSDPAVIGSVIAGHKVRPMSDLPQLVRERNILIGIIAVPAAAAQQVADALIKAGVKGILNFAPIRLEVDHHVSVDSVDFLLSLEQLAFQVSLGLAGSLDERDGE
ncbi:MAG: redox-sensing transcriptional repressor Rex [Phycisphaerales bacterium]|nr:redox-sensing transcriptional repressor Rex [Phycisphaerales bacterium]MCI0630364.1 redox-sensing transcriptional repressor Rex [Phycisphaerales bacterium]MCI0677353.1 redox-sensing transcriptional repressor Rex [Phycisphaerales bacterium]